MSLFLVQLIITFVVASLNLLIGLLIYLKNPRSVTNRFLAIIALIVALWAVSNLFSLNYQDSPSLTLFWIRAVMVITAWLGPIMFLFVKSYPKAEIQLSKTWVGVVLGYATLTCTLAFTPLMFSGVSIVNGNITPIPGPAIALFAIGFVGMILASLIMLVFKYAKAKGKEKIQMLYLLLGMILSFGFMVFANFIMVIVFQSSGLVFLGPSSSIILISLVSYAIIRHRFLDLKLVLFRAASFSILLLIITLLYVTGVVTIGSYLFDLELSTRALYFIVGTSLILAWSFPFMQKFVETTTAPIFFRNIYDESSLLKRIGMIISRTIVLEKLVKQVFAVLNEEMNISGAYIEVFEQEDKVWTHASNYESVIDNEKIKRLARELMKESDEQIYVFEEIENEKVKEQFRQFGIGVLLPLVVKKELVGVILLSEKASGEIYSTRDVDVLKIIGAELAIGIKNATAYQVSQDFNTILKEEVKKATTELRSANKRLRDLDARKDEFISIASHELRTPLTAIKSYLWMVLNEPAKPLDSRVKQDIEISYGATERLIHLVNDMLTVSRIESDRIDLRMASVDVVELLNLLMNELRVQAQARKIDFVFNSSLEKKVINGDKDKLHEVFMNIIGNALKFVPDSGFVKVDIQEEKDKVVITVKDNGPGIRKEDRDKLFSKFGKIDFAYNQAKSMSGTGLGLYISKQIVRLHGGSIEVESEVGKGATFIVSLPVKAGK